MARSILVIRTNRRTKRTNPLLAGHALSPRRRGQSARRKKQGQNMRRRSGRKQEAVLFPRLRRDGRVEVIAGVFARSGSAEERNYLAWILGKSGPRAA